MNGLLWLLGFGVLFFFAMRYVCGAYVADGAPHAPRHRKDDDAGHAAERTQDPVCGVNVVLGRGYAMALNGRTYRFCSRACLDQFEAAPERFTRS
jgi:YHS domain-containing protein